MDMEAAQTVAHEMHAKHGDGAAHIAAERADECNKAGDAPGFYHWNIVCAIITSFRAGLRSSRADA